MPWAIFNRPSIQLATLQGYLKENLPEISVQTYHPYLDVAKSIGTDTYHTLSKDIWGGEALYSALLFPRQKTQARDVFRRSLGSKALRKLPEFDALVSRLDEHLDVWLSGLDLSTCSLAGFSVCFGQLPGSLLAVRRLKKRFPKLPIVLGGSTCAPDIAASLLQVFPEIDYIVSGEGEQPLLGLCRFLDGQVADPGSGVARQRRSSPHLASTGTDNQCELADLDALSLPDFDDYFSQLRASGLNFMPVLPVEFSRGCWWNKCAFCNLNLQWCGYRRKTSRQMIREVEQLRQRYQCLDFSFTDNALPPREAEHFFDAMRTDKADLRFFAEIRTIRTPETYNLFGQGGLTDAQIGIEALSDSLLNRMNKGSTVMDNFSAMKSCAQAGIRLDGNLILEFPGSTAAEVEETLRNLDFALPFRPLQAAGFFLGHGSEVWKNPGAFGIRSVVPHPYNTKLYPRKILSRLQLLICSGQGDQVHQRKIWQPVRKKMTAWTAFHKQRTGQPHALTYRDGREFIIIRQDLPDRPVLHHRLKGLSRRIYLACDLPVSRKDLLRRFKSVTEKQLDAFLADLEEKRLLFRHREKCLALAIRSPGA